MPQEIGGILSWMSEATLAGLLAYILWGSSKRKWYWDHYVDELKKDKDFWQQMALQLLQTNKSLVRAEENRAIGNNSRTAG